MNAGYLFRELYYQRRRTLTAILGLSIGKCVTGEMLRAMADHPIVFALANPVPEISFEEARAARSDVIIATGRSDYPNQINNVLAFPGIFRGALDARARQITEKMKMSAAMTSSLYNRHPTRQTTT